MNRDSQLTPLLLSSLFAPDEPIFKANLEPHALSARPEPPYLCYSFLGSRCSPGSPPTRAGWLCSLHLLGPSTTGSLDTYTCARYLIQELVRTGDCGGSYHGGDGAAGK